MLDQRRTQLWHAMRLGPIWQKCELASQPAETVADVTTKDASPAPGSASCDTVPAPQADDARSAQIATLSWDDLKAAVSACTACQLCRSRKQTVFGVGLPQAQWMLVGEAPGAEEDARGEPFVGQAGKLLDNMLAAVGLSRTGDDPATSVFIANVLKCRPPGNRNPEPAEVALCDPFLKRQIALVQPRMVIVMGRFAAQSLLGTDASIASLRGRVHHIDGGGRKVPVVVTYHPAYLLRNLADKAKSWADLCLARQAFDIQA